MADIETENKITYNGGRGNGTIHESSRVNKIIGESKAEIGAVEESNAEESVEEFKTAEQSVEEGKTVEKAVEEGKIVEKAVEEGKIVEKAVEEGKIVEEAVEEGKTENEAADEGKKICHAVDIQGLEDAKRRCWLFAKNTYLDLKRTYDIFKKGISDIKEESIKLPQLCSPPYAESIHRYESIEGLEMYAEIAYSKNGYEKLKRKFKEKMLNLGNNSDPLEFLLQVALIFYSAFDLKEVLGFTEAPNLAVDALGYAMITTDQVEWLDEYADLYSE